MKTEKQIKKELLNDIEWGVKILYIEKLVNHLYILSIINSILIAYFAVISYLST